MFKATTKEIGFCKYPLSLSPIIPAPKNLHWEDHFLILTQSTHSSAGNTFNLSTGEHSWTISSPLWPTVNMTAYLKIEWVTTSPPQKTTEPPSKTVFTEVLHNLCFSDTKLMQHKNWLEAILPFYPHHWLLPFHFYPYNFPNVSCCFNYACFYNFAHATCSSLCLEYCNPPLNLSEQLLFLLRNSGFPLILGHLLWFIKISWEIFRQLFIPLSVKTVPCTYLQCTLIHTLSHNYPFIYIPQQGYNIP